MKGASIIKTIAHRVGLDIRRYPGILPRRRLALLLAHHRIDVVLDVGANVGQYARSLREFGYDGRIVSFEPMREAYETLTKEAMTDPNWTVQHCALGEQCGEALINVSANSISSSILPMNPTHANAVPHSRYVASESITVERLDDVIGWGSVVCPNDRLFLKIDTQGFEKQVLAGAPDAMKRIVGVQLELSFVTLYDGQMLLPEALDEFTSNGMTLEGIEEGFVHTDGRMFQMDGIFFRR